jgi:class 3 adenylate cyclase
MLNPFPFNAMNEELFQQRMNQIRKIKPSLVMGLDEVTEWILQSDVFTRHRINPFVIQSQAGLGLRKVVAILLAGTKAGAFRMHWDLHCPHCNMITDEFSSLRESRGHSHCKMCNSSFLADFHKRVEVTFSLHPEIEVVDIPANCAPPPKLKPLVEIGIPKGGREMRSIEITEGRYRFFCPITMAKGILEVSGPVSSETQVLEVTQLIDASYDKMHAQLQPGKVDVIFKNPDTPFSGLFLISDDLKEELGLEDTGIRLTGLQAIHYPEFQEFFGTDTLSVKEKMSISKVAILFTDITGSTKMYEELGDIKAYELVREHFDLLIDIIQMQGGVIVKTIGDAVMASFVQSENALQTVFKCIDKFSHFNEPRDFREQIHVKFGIHEGSCILVNLNDRVDFFGTTVNKAARIQGLATKDEFCISEEMFLSHATKDILKINGVTRVRRSQKALKGLSGSHSVYFISNKKESG